MVLRIARRLLGFVKDRVAMERVRLRTHRGIGALQVCVITATSHEEQPPSKELLQFILQAGSRMRVSHCASLLVERMRKTRSWVVALKCLTLTHRALQQGDSVYQHHLLITLHPKNGGKSCLNFSRFRDRSSPLAWQASSWIRWYAGFLEALIRAFSISSTGPFPSLQSDGIVVKLARIQSLEALLHEICNCPMLVDHAPTISLHLLIVDAFRLVVRDSIAKHDELSLQLKEACQRHGELTILQITELLRICETLIKERELFAKLIELAISLNLLHPKPSSYQGVPITDNELMDIRAAFVVASQGWNAPFGGGA